jgi:hypothetical protein
MNQIATAKIKITASAINAMNNIVPPAGIEPAS